VKSLPESENSPRRPADFVGRIIVNNEKVAFIGEIHPQVLLNWTIDMPVAVLELNLTDLFRLMHFPSEPTLEQSSVHDNGKSEKEQNMHRSERNSDFSLWRWLRQYRPEDQAARCSNPYKQSGLRLHWSRISIKDFVVAGK